MTFHRVTRSRKQYNTCKRIVMLFIIIPAWNGDGIMIVNDGDNNTGGRDYRKATGQGYQINLNSMEKNSRRGKGRI